MRGSIEIGGPRRSAAFAECVELLGVPLLDHAEAAELALDSVVVAVVVGVTGHEVVAADVVKGLHPLDDVDWEGNPGDPGVTVLLVLQVEPAWMGHTSPWSRHRGCS